MGIAFSPEEIRLTFTVVGLFLLAAPFIENVRRINPLIPCGLFLLGAFMLLDLWIPYREYHTSTGVVDFIDKFGIMQLKPHVRIAGEVALVLGCFFLLFDRRVQ